MKYKVKLKNIEMTKAEICFEVRPAVSILPPLTQMTDISKFGIEPILFFFLTCAPAVPVVLCQKTLNM